MISKKVFLYPIENQGYVNILLLFAAVCILAFVENTLSQISSSAYLIIPVIGIEFIIYIFAFDYLAQIASHSRINSKSGLPYWKIDNINISFILSKALLPVISIVESIIIMLPLVFILRNIYSIGYNNLLIYIFVLALTLLLLNIILTKGLNTWNPLALIEHLGVLKFFMCFIILLLLNSLFILPLDKIWNIAILRAAYVGIFFYLYQCIIYYLASSIDAG
ncbi:MAG: hypothetical protein SVK54_05000 [candidate division WOR-3 bacterium]|nr:hypothetical protein [candidate division WOR-3 bacterium]